MLGSKPRKEAVNHPSHYGGADNVYEVIKVIEAWSCNFNIGQLLRYTGRAGKKIPSKHLEDLKKGAWYLNREIQNLEKAEVWRQEHKKSKSSILPRPKLAEVQLKTGFVRSARTATKSRR